VLTSWVLLSLVHSNRIHGFRDAWIVGPALAVTGIVAFFGLYISVRKIRVALAGGLFFPWLAVTAYAFSIENFGTFVTNQSEIWTTFRRLATTAIAFYFGSEAIIQGVKVWQAGQVSQEGVKRNGKVPSAKDVRAALDVDVDRSQRARGLDI